MTIFFLFISAYLKIISLLHFNTNLWYRLLLPLQIFMFSLSPLSLLRISKSSGVFSAVPGTARSLSVSKTHKSCQLADLVSFWQSPACRFLWNRVSAMLRLWTAQSLFVLTLHTKSLPSRLWFSHSQSSTLSVAVSCCSHRLCKCSSLHLVVATSELIGFTAWFLLLFQLSFCIPCSDSLSSTFVHQCSLAQLKPSHC